MTFHRTHPRQQGFSMQGFSMLEVLIAVLVFSLGMIGLAGLLIFAIQSNHVAYLRTQATFLAHNMADRMAANPAGLWADPSAYNGDYPVPAAAVSCAAGCNPTQLAAFDMQQWSAQLRTFLPNVAGNIDCVTDGVTYIPTRGSGGQVGFRPPYGGTCTMQLAWNEANSASGKQSLRTFVWKFQP